MPQASAPSHFPVRKAISRRLWKIWGIGVISLTSAAAIVVASQAAAAQSERLGPGFVRLFSLPESRAATFFSATLLMLAGQLALLIWWVRSRSLNDFKGHYRVWTWAAGASFVGAFALVTDGHLALSETICWLWTEPFRNKEVLCWLSPATAVGMVLVWLLKNDMRDCRSSVSMLWLAAVCGSVWSLLAIDLQVPAVVNAYRSSIQLGLGMFTIVCLFMSMLLHARFVVYSTAEPPRKQPPWFRFRFRERRMETDGDEMDQPAATKKKSADKPAAKAKTSVKPEKQKRRAAKPKQATPAKLNVVPASVDEDSKEAMTEKSSLPTKPQTESSATVSAENLLDGPPDTESLNGLNKRERRLLRKQRKEQQREERRRA